MNLIRWPLFAALLLTTACTSGGGDDTDTDVGAPDDTDPTGSDDEPSDDEPSDDESSDETDVGGDTDDTDSLGTLPGTPVTMVNPGFESVALAAGGESYKRNGDSTSLTIEGWTYYLGTAGSGVGVSRPTEARFGVGEPLAAPADGNLCGYLDARAFDDANSGSSQLSSALPAALATGDVLHARIALAARIDNTSVALHDSIVLGVAYGDESVAAVYATVPTDGSWADTTITYEVPEGRNGQTPRVYVSASQSPLAVAYHQTYVDNLRVSVE